MKIKIYIYLVTLISFKVFGQIGIGTTTPNPKSILDINSTNAGVLFPRVTSTQRIAIAPSATDFGMKVYDITTKTFWYWNGTSWVEMITPAAASLWNLTGNSGTSAVTNFAGSLDGVDFVTKTNNIERMRVTSTGNVGIGTSSPSTKLHINSATSPALRIVDGTQGIDKVLTSDASGNARWEYFSNILAFGGMVIPVCDFVSVGSSGSFNVVIRGVNTTVTWYVQAKALSTASFPTNTQRLQVRYDFSPALPFNPSGISLTALNNSSWPDVFTLNYASKSQSSMTVNIARTDLIGFSTNAWQGQFYFDVMIVE